MATLDPVVTTKPIVLWLCLICRADDTNQHSLTVTGSVYGLTIRLFINEIAANASNGILLDGNVQVKINCENRTITIPDDSPCSNTSCLG